MLLVGQRERKPAPFCGTPTGFWCSRRTPSASVDFKRNLNPK